MQKPTLVVMAAGMGSRYGGLKQIDPVGRHGEIIMDYSLFDAMQAGFEKVVFIINRKIEHDFYEVIGRRAEKHLEVHLRLPAAGSDAPRRVRRTGRARQALGHGARHPLLQGRCARAVCRHQRGRLLRQARLFRFVRLPQERARRQKYDFSMVGYEAQNTLTENGHVARGVCEVNDKGELVNIVERLASTKRRKAPRIRKTRAKRLSTSPRTTSFP